MNNTDFKQMVSEDIKRCDEALSSDRNVTMLLSELVGKYSKVSNNFPDIEMNPVLFKRHPNVPKENLQAIQGFLKTYLLNNCEDYRFDDAKNMGINVITNINNSNENNVKTESFSEVKNKVENMTSLSDSEIDEILSKINELEEIINSSERKSKKWSRATNIIKWVADKGIDVGMALLPLILKLGE